MAKIYKNAAELVGNTPLLEVGNLEKELGLEARILVKLEYFNPAGSEIYRDAASDSEKSSAAAGSRIYSSFQICTVL